MSAESGFVFLNGVPMDIGAHGEHDFVYHENDEVTDRGESAFVFEEGTGVGSQNLVGWWKFDESSGSTAVDETGRNDGTYQNDYTLGVSGQDGTAVSLNASGRGYIDIGGNYDLDEYTLAIWVNPDRTDVDGSSSDTEGSPYQIVEFSNELRMEIANDNDADLEYRLVFEDGHVERILTSGGFITSGWTHLIFTYDSSEVKLFKDGSLVAGRTYTGTAAVNGGFKVGRDFEDESQYWDGAFDDLRLYNTGFDDDEASSLYDSYNP